MFVQPDPSFAHSALDLQWQSCFQLHLEHDYYVIRGQAAYIKAHASCWNFNIASI